MCKEIDYSDPEIHYILARDLCGPKAPFAEQTIAKSIETSYLYARDVLKDPDPETWRRRYLAREVVYYPWKAIEDI